MSQKEQILHKLSKVFADWRSLVADLSEEQLTDPSVPGKWTIKDVLAHLYAWQQVTNARLTAALNHHEPSFPEWLAGLDPESWADLEKINNRIYETYAELSWLEVYNAWQTGFQNGAHILLVNGIGIGV